MSDQIRTRFAPSPTGHLHVGGARTAIYCWAFAKASNGVFLLRIEDTDQKRSSDLATQGIFNDLLWLGVSWDEGPKFGESGCSDSKGVSYFQSKRLDLYKQHLQKLIDEGGAYYAFETPEELNEERKQARKEKRAYRYNRAALDLSPQTVKQYLEDGKPHVIRFRVPEGGSIKVDDAVVGVVEVERSEVDDFVICKADGFPTYHFAVVVDDELMNVTHVIRGQEHLNNTFKHVLLQEAMGFDRPVFAHLSLIFNQDGSKMSKRDKDKALRAVVNEREITSPPNACISSESWETWLSNKDNQLEMDEASSLADAFGIELPEINIEDFRKAGYLPEVLLNYLCLLGWSPGGDIEQFDADFLVEHFSLDRIVKSPAKFDRLKLLAFNLDALQRMSSEEFETRLLQWCNTYAPTFANLGDKFQRFAAANHARSKTFKDAIVTSGFLIESDYDISWPDSKQVRKALQKGDPTGLTLLAQANEALISLDQWDDASLDSCLSKLAEAEAGGKLGRVAQPIRIAVAGGPVSPPISDTLILLGRDSSLRRIERCLEHFASVCDV